MLDIVSSLIIATALTVPGEGAAAEAAPATDNAPAETAQTATAGAAEGEKPAEEAPKAEDAVDTGAKAEAAEAEKPAEEAPKAEAAEAEKPAEEAAKPADADKAAEKIADAVKSAADSAAKLAAAFAELSDSLKKPTAAEAKAAEEASEASKWSGLVGVSLISMTGNTNSLTTTANLKLRRESEKWIFQFKADGAYGRTRPEDVLITPDDGTDPYYEEQDPETVALNATVEARGDFRFTKMVSLYLMGGGMTDHVNSIEARYYGEAGISLIWIDQKEGDLSTLRLQTDIAFRSGKELRFNYYPSMGNVDDEIIAAPRFALAFRYAMTEGLVFTEDVEVLPNVVGDSRVWITSLTKLSMKLYKALSFNVSFLVKHDSNPVDDKDKTDTTLTVGLELTF